MPDPPLIRPETREIIDHILRFDISGVPSHLAIIGSRGSGKTLALRYLQRVIPEQSGLSVLHVNCRHHNTSYRILGHLLASPFAGSSLAELFARFEQQHAGKTVIVLDEVDLMSPKDRRRELVYLLSRSERPYMVILLSNNPHVLKQLDAATLSSLQALPMHFANYDASQIGQILDDRARNSLSAWEAGDLAKIAALTVQRANSDCRVAIKTLFYHVTQPETDLDRAFEHARRDLVVDLIQDLNDQNLMILLAACQSSNRLARPVHDRYSQLCRAHGDRPFSLVHFYAQLGYLQSCGLIVLAATKTGRTYTNRILPMFESEIVEQLARLRLE